MVQAQVETKAIILKPVGIVQASDEQAKYSIQVYPEYTEALLQ